MPIAPSEKHLPRNMLALPIVNPMRVVWFFSCYVCHVFHVKLYTSGLGLKVNVHPNATVFRSLGVPWFDFK